MPRPHAFVVSRATAGHRLGDVLRQRLSLRHDEAARLVRERRVRIDGSVCADPARKVQPGQRVEVAGEAPPRPRRPRTSTSPAGIQIHYLDEHLVVVDKPAGLTTMRHPEEVAQMGPRAGKFLPPTLADLLPGLLPTSRRGNPARVTAVHRLDRDTTGLVVFARTEQAVRDLGRQFRTHTIERAYHALVRGRPPEGTIESWLVPDRGDGRRGSGGTRGEGQKAVTHVRLLEALGRYSLVECRLETGRTHQVRIHLGEAGAPLCGESIYDRPLHGAPLPDDSGATRTALHAAVLAIDHPATGARLRWTSPLPADLAQLLERLRLQAS